MSTADIDTYQVDKRQRDMEINRQKRMRAFEEREAAERDPNDPAGWGGSDEEVQTITPSICNTVILTLLPTSSLMRL